MTLEQWQKITDIALKGVVAVGLAVGTYMLTRDQSEMNRSKLCGEIMQQNFDFVQANFFSDARKTMLDAKLETQQAICEGVKSQKYVAVLNNSWKSPATVAEASGATPQPSNGELAKADGASAPAVPAPLEVEKNLNQAQWVAVSRKNDSSYSALNFDVRQGDKSTPNKVGNVIMARWFVNIREANTPVVSGKNRVIGQLLAGQCVRIEEAVSGTLNEWARVVRLEQCPA